jgi:hypothetical protein
MKHLVTIDITTDKDKYLVTMHFEKICKTFKVRTLKEAMQKCEALIEAEKAKNVIDCEDSNKDSKRVKLT